MFESVVFGCGNELLGDDGFGSRVIRELSRVESWSETVGLFDVGTGIREYLFDYLLVPSARPVRLVVVDAVDYAGKSPGEVFVLDPSRVPCEKIHDFSLHQFPTVNLLKELQQQAGIVVSIVAVQVKSIPESVCPGLSPEVEGAVPAACEKISTLLRGDRVMSEDR